MVALASRAALVMSASSLTLLGVAALTTAQAVTPTATSAQATAAQTAWTKTTVAQTSAAQTTPAQVAAVRASRPALGWRVDHTIAKQGGFANLVGIDATSSRDAWAVGFEGKATAAFESGLITRWNGRVWQTVTLPGRISTRWGHSNPDGAAVGATSYADVWVADSTAYIHLSGTRWTLGTVPGNASSKQDVKSVDIFSVRAFSRTSAWLFGDIDTISNSTEHNTFSPYAAHFNGQTFVQVPVPGQGSVTAVSAVSPDNMWAVVSQSEFTHGPTDATVVHWAGPGAGWQAVAVQPKLPAGTVLNSVLAQPGGQVWAGGGATNSKATRGTKGKTEVVARWNGHAWAVTRLPASPSRGRFTMISLVPDGRGGLWGLGQAGNRLPIADRLWHLQRGKWSLVRPDFGHQIWTLQQLTAVPHAASAWAAGTTHDNRDGLIAIVGQVPH